MGDVLEIVRDAVEIAAITLAGVWALYVFVYENRVKPLQGAPELTFSATMERLGEHDGLTAVRLRTQTKNVGTVRVQFIAVSMTVLGSRIIESPRPQPAKATAAFNRLQTYYTSSHSQAVYRDVFLTRMADPSIPADAWLEPGGVDNQDRIFYVPTKRFDLLVAWAVSVYTKHDDKTVPTTLSIRPNGLPHFEVHGNDNEQFSTDLTSLDLAKP